MASLTRWVSGSDPVAGTAASVAVMRPVSQAAPHLRRDRQRVDAERSTAPAGYSPVRAINLLAPEVGVTVVAGVLTDELLQVPAGAAGVAASAVSTAATGGGDQFGGGLLARLPTFAMRDVDHRRIDVEVPLRAAVGELAPHELQVDLRAERPRPVDALHLGQVAHQPEQRQRRRRRRALDQLGRGRGRRTSPPGRCDGRRATRTTRRRTSPSAGSGTRSGATTPTVSRPPGSSRLSWQRAPGATPVCDDETRTCRRRRERSPPRCRSPRRPAVLVVGPGTRVWECGNSDPRHSGGRVGSFCVSDARTCRVRETPRMLPRTRRNVVGNGDRSAPIRPRFAGFYSQLLGWDIVHEVPGTAGRRCAGGIDLRRVPGSSLTTSHRSGHPTAPGRGR